ncbi:MAG TPA: hypothetical protein VGF67_14575 [Ktedonobacteraceae bacterium]|jgi:hypothetical protein
MKTFADDTDRSDDFSGQIQDEVINKLSDAHLLHVTRSSRGDGKAEPPGRYTRFFPHFTLAAMICALLLMDAILPLRDLWFHESTLTQLGVWPVFPSLLLFPGWSVIPPLPHVHVYGLPDIPASWVAATLLLGAFVVVFLVYTFALRRLPARISRRFIFRSTLVLGVLFLTIPVVTSPDLYSYIAYARIGSVHGLNPLTTIPRTIHSDMIYTYISWVDQPSAYGPSWTLLTCFFQSLFTLCGLGNYLITMVLTLRIWGLVMHLASTWLIWSISGSLQRLHGIVSRQRQLRITLAFAWNPLLLLEACTNAHNDTTLLFLLLLAIQFLVRRHLKSEPGTAQRQNAWLSPATRSRLAYLAPAALLALGTCLKINLALLAPGLFLYQWLQEAEQPCARRLRRVGSSLATYVGLIAVLYAPFWNGGAIFNVFEVNPAASRTINTLPDTLSHLYNGLAAALGFPVGAPIGSPAEHVLHTLSMGLFVLIYAALGWRVVRHPQQVRTIHGLVRWLTLTWLLYCAVGSPWFWPWYMVTFFGLYALFESSKPAQAYLEEKFSSAGLRQTSLARLCAHMQALLLHPDLVRLLTLSMLTLYCFVTWGPQHTFLPFLPGFVWSYFGGLWAWVLPVLLLTWTRVRGRASLV